MKARKRAFALVRQPMRPTRTVLHSPLLRRAGAAPVQKHLEQRVVFYGLERRRQADESPDCPAAQDAPRNRLTRPKPIAFEAGLGTRYGQSQQFSIFHVPKLRRALSNHQSKSRTGDRGRRISLPGLQRVAYSPRWKVRAEIFSVARRTPPTRLTRPAQSKPTSPSRRKEKPQPAWGCQPARLT